MDKPNIKWSRWPLLIGLTAVATCVTLAAVKGGTLGIVAAAIAIAMLFAGRKEV
jgi:hypothetical protein